MVSVNLRKENVESVESARGIRTAAVVFLQIGHNHHPSTKCFFPVMFGHPPLFLQIVVRLYQERDVYIAPLFQDDTTKANNKSYRLFVKL